MVLIDSSMNELAVHSPVQPATAKRKLRSTWSPWGVCTTSGWNWIPRWPASFAITAIGESSE